MESRRKYQGCVGAVTLVLLLISCSGARAVDFAGGTGEPNDPYQIATAEQLIGMADDPNLYDKDFVLTADIDLDPNLPGRRIFLGSVVPWTGIRSRGGGGSGGPFSGDFDGNGHTIRNCQIYNKSTSSYAGLFGTIGTSARIHDLHLENVLIADGSDSGVYCGALVGGNSGFVARCSVAGTILTHSEESMGGGLIGNNAGTVVDCHARCEVFGTQVGGLVGINREAGRIVFSSSNGMVLGDRNAGGLACTNEGTIQYSFAEGTAFGSRAGGLVYNNRGTVRESYAATIASWAGLIGANSGMVLNCYAKGVILFGTAGGLVGSNEGTIVSSYCTTVLDVPGADPQPLPLGGTSPFGGDMRQCYYLVTKEPVDVGSPRTDGARFAEEMKQRASLPGLDFYGDPNDGIADHWFMPEDGYPILTWQADLPGVACIPDVSGLTLERAQDLLLRTGFTPRMVRHDYAHTREVYGYGGWQEVSTEGETLYACPSHHASPGDPVDIVVSLGPYDFAENAGDGTETNPYQIETPGQLDTLSNQTGVRTQHFILMADIDLTYRTYPDALFGSFAGTFDGNGHTFRYAGGNGLFRTIEPGGVVRNLTLEQVSIIARPDSSHIGMLAGQNRGSIADCSASGRVFAGDSYIGGLVGRNEGQISRCTVSGQIWGGEMYIGGLVGRNEGQISRCTVSGQILGGEIYIGGLVGSNSGQIVDSRVLTLSRLETWGSNVGGLVGTNYQFIARCCVLQASLAGDRSIGGLVGVNFGTEAWIENSYARGGVQGVESVGGLVGTHSGASLSTKHDLSG